LRAGRRRSAFARKLEHVLNTYRHPDGREWTGAEIEKVTAGIVQRSYTTNPRKGRIESPGYEKMRAIAKAMGFPPEAWFDETPSRAVARVESQDIARRVEHLFEAVRNPKTDKPYTNAEIARMSLGDLSRESVEGIRTGAIGDPTVGQVAALASVFGVEPSSLLDRGEPLFDEELVEALRNRTVREATREISPLSEKERRLLLESVRQSGRPNSTSSRQNSRGTD
jgi:transcriptional regulator with XRE-family HTH domain